MRCSNCGTEFEEGMFCPECGTKYEGVLKDSEGEVKEEVEKGSVRAGEDSGTSQCAIPVDLERISSEIKPQKKRKTKKILIGIGGVFLILSILVIITSLVDGGSSNSGESQEMSAEIKTLEEVGGFEQWKEDGFPGMVRANICTFIQTPLQTDKNHEVFFIGSVDEGIGVIFQEDKKPISEWEWLMNAEPDEDTQVVWFNGILKYIGAADEYPVFLISDVEEGTYWEDDGTYDTLKEEDYAELDLEELIGQPEEVLEELGFIYRYSMYTIAGGKVVADCTDGIIDFIRISEDDTWKIHGIKIGMGLEEADALLADRYSKADEQEQDARMYYTSYIDKESGSGIDLISDNGVITDIVIAYDTGEELQEEQSQEYIFPDSDSRYLSEEEVRRVEVDKLRIARNEIFARHGYIFNDKELSQYFSNMSWYTGTVPAEQFDLDVILNDFEKKNIKVIESVENQMTSAELEDILLQQPCYVESIDYNRNEVGYGADVCIVVKNNSGADIKNVFYAMACWDENDLPLILYTYKKVDGTGYVVENDFGAVNMIDGDTFGEDLLLSGFSLFHIVEFLNRETKLWETNKPPAMQVCQHCFSLQ